MNCGAKAWRALECSMERLSQEISPLALFPQPPVVHFAPERDTCHCGLRLKVQKTRFKTVKSMNGLFWAHEKVLECLVCSRSFYSEELLRMVPRHCNVSYDVLVFVGEALFRRYRTAHEIRMELAERNISLSASEITYLGHKFITYLSAAHRLAIPRIRETMKLAGGYILHLDATHDEDAPALMTGMDGLSDIVLANVKVPSEHADHIIPFLRKLKADYGTPKACVHDMGVGICKAVAEVFPGILDFICHFHFLRDIGKDFLEPAYGELRKSLRKHAVSSRLHALVREAKRSLHEQCSDFDLLAKSIQASEISENKDILPLVSTYLLALHTLNGKRCGDGYGFPFDRPLLEFAERLIELNRRLAELLDLFPSDNRNPLHKLTREIKGVTNDKMLYQKVEELRWRCQVFDNLRKAMRIAPAGGNNGLNDDGTVQVMLSIRQGVEQFRQGLDKSPKLASDTLSRKMAEQLDKYGDKLFADPIEVDTPNGKVIIYFQRTNNMIEQFFRGLRRWNRRKTGNDSMRLVLQTMLADTPLIKNLDNPDYMKILLDGKADLRELFAEIEEISSAKAADPESEVDRISPRFKKLIAMPTLFEQLVRLFRRQSEMAKSN